MSLSLFSISEKYQVNERELIEIMLKDGWISQTAVFCFKDASLSIFMPKDKAEREGFLLGKEPIILDSRFDYNIHNALGLHALLGIPVEKPFVTAKGLAKLAKIVGEKKPASDSVN